MGSNETREGETWERPKWVVMRLEGETCSNETRGRDLSG